MKKSPKNYFKPSSSLQQPGDQIVRWLRKAPSILFCLLFLIMKKSVDHYWYLFILLSLITYKNRTRIVFFYIFWFAHKCVYMFVLYAALSADIQNRQLFFPTFSLILYSSHEYTIAQGPFHLITTHKWKLLYKGWIVVEPTNYNLIYIILYYIQRYLRSIVKKFHKKKKNTYLIIHTKYYTTETWTPKCVFSTWWDWKV